MATANGWNKAYKSWSTVPLNRSDWRIVAILRSLQVFHRLTTIENRYRVSYQPVHTSITLVCGIAVVAWKVIFDSTLTNL